MRTVLTVDSLAGVVDPVTGAEPMFVKAERAGIDFQAAGKIGAFALSAGQLPDWAVPDGVRERGRRVRDALCAHPGLPKVLDHLASAPIGSVAPLFMKLGAGDPERIPWEALCDAEGEFLALDSRWPIGRITDPMASTGRPAAVLQLPVRLMAVISAYGVDGQKAEWQALAKAVADARAAGLPVDVKVLVGEDATRAAVQASIDGGMTGVSMGGIESTGARLVQEIVAFAPNIVHFFCHGHAGSTPADQRLELATASDHAALAGAGSVRVGRRQLTDMLQALFNPWLMVLNCCASATAATDLRSLASDVVASGFPAAVAMTEPVERRDAHEFSRAFYRSLFNDLARTAKDLAQKAAGAPTARVAFEFAGAMHDARSAICDLHGGDAANQRAWLLPVLYVRGIEPLEFESPPVASTTRGTDGVAADPDDADHRLRARLAAQWLQQVRDTLDADGRAEVLAAMLDGVPPAFWPDIDGAFGNPGVPR